MGILDGKRILITGGFGYIGKHVVRAFEGSGAEIEIWDNRDPFTKTGVLVFPHKVDGLLDWVRDSSKVSYNKIDIAENWFQLDHYKKTKHFDVIIHLAAVSSVPAAEENPQRAREVNVWGTHEISGLAKKWDALLLHADSAMSPLGQSVYADTKKIAARVVRANPKGVNLTLFNVAGADTEGDIGEDHDPETHFIPNLVDSLIRGEIFKIDANQAVKRDFVHVSDVAEAFLKAVELHFEGKLTYQKDYQVGTGIERSLSTVAIESAYILDAALKLEQFTSGRFEPYDYYREKGLVSAKFAADPSEWVPGWVPKRLIYQIVFSQHNFQKKRLERSFAK